MSQAPGKSHRKGISLFDLMQMFPDENTARLWFESIMWKNGRHCPHCGSVRSVEVKNHKPMPYRCMDCRKFFSVRQGTVLEQSKVPLQKWAVAIFLYCTSLKSVSSMKLHRDIKVTQKTAWFMMQRIREASPIDSDNFVGPVEVDETYMGGKRRNMSNSKRKELEGRGAVGKKAVVGVKDRATKQVRAKVVEYTDKETLQSFVLGHVAKDATVYTDEAHAYKGLPREHKAVKHSAGQYVDGMAHTNGIESFWSMLKRAYQGTFHHFSVKHMQRYVTEFAGRHNLRECDTAEIMTHMVAGMIGRRLTYKRLISENQA